MGDKTYHMVMPFDLFSTVSFYDSTEIPTGEGGSYRQRQLEPRKLRWRWFVNRRTGEAVRAFFCVLPLRVLAGPTMEIPSHMYVLHDIESVWALSPQDFERSYVALDTLLHVSGALRHDNAGG